MEPKTSTPAASTPQASSSGNYVGFWRRFAGLFIDAIILSIVGGILQMIFPTAQTSTTTMMYPGVPTHMNTQTNFGLGSGISFLINIAYYVYFWSQQNGQTIGARALKFKVMREDGKKLDALTAFIRYIGYIISGVVFCLGFLWVIWDKKKQGWHDKMAQTVVVPA